MGTNIVYKFKVKTGIFNISVGKRRIKGEGVGCTFVL